MRIIAYGTLKAHWELPSRADSQEPLIAWHNIARLATWRIPADIKRQFRSASFVGDRVVFTIAGNKYRLVVSPNDQWLTIYIRFVRSHAEYDEINGETI